VRRKGLVDGNGESKQERGEIGSLGLWTNQRNTYDERNVASRAGVTVAGPGAADVVGFLAASKEKQVSSSSLVESESAGARAR
jgi:hypothetical protein